MAALRNRLLGLASGQTDLDAVVSSVEAASRVSRVNAETILGELDDAFSENILDFESFSILKRSVVTTILKMDSSEQKLDFDLTAAPDDFDDRTQLADPDRTQLADPKGRTNITGAPGESVDVRPGMILRGRFYVDEVLGKGGMGTVFKGRDALKMEARDRNPYIAIKVLNEEIRERPDAFIALQREASRQQRLAHPNIATVYDFDRVGSVIFITMELLEGTPLDEYIESEVAPRGGLSFEEALPIIKSLGEGLQYAHDSNIIHSDFKPSNCFLTADHEVKILDFGIARAVSKPGQRTRTLFDGSDLGAMTPSYASFEMLESLGDPHPGDDVYALACVAYELLTGKHPFKSLPANIVADNNLKPRPIEKLTRSQNRALARGIEIHRKDRTPSATEFVQALAGSAGDEKKSWRFAAIAGVTAIAFVAAVIFGVWRYQQSQLDGIVAAVVTGDQPALETALRQIGELDVDQRQQILSDVAVKDRITAFFEQDISDKAKALNFDAVNESLVQARILYSDSARIENAAQNAIEEKNRLLGELSETYESLLKSRKLLSDPNADDIPDVIERLKKIAPQHSLITDARLASTYAHEADRLISAYDFRGAIEVIETGLLLSPENAALINTQDRLDKERVTAERRVRLQQLEIKLAPAVAAIETLSSFKRLSTELIALADLAPESKVLADARDRIRPIIEDRLSALDLNLKLSPLVELGSEYARLLKAIGLTGLGEQVTALRDAALTRVEELTNGIADAIAWGNLDSPAGDNAASKLLILRAIAPGDIRVDELQDKLINAYLSKAHDKILAGAWDEARSQIAHAGKQPLSPNFEARLQSTLGDIDSAEQQANERLASDNQTRIEREKQARIADLEQQITSEIKAAKTIADSRQILQKIRRLETIAPSSQLLNTTRETLAEKLSAAAIGKGTNGGDWDAALKDMKTVDSLFPDSAVVAKARVRVETEREKARTLAKENEIKQLRAKLTQLASEKVDNAWSDNTTTLLTKLAAQVSSDDSWLTQMRGQLTGLYLIEVKKLRSAQRFTLANQQLDRAEGINPGAEKIRVAREALKAGMAEFAVAQREKDIAARIEAHKQTFIAHIKSKQITSAKKTLALLKQDLSSEDPFITTEAPTLLAEVYLQFANSKIAQKDFDAAIGFARSGLKYRSEDAELLAALNTAKTEIAQSKEPAAVATPSPAAKAVVTKPAVIDPPTPVKAKPLAVPTLITEQQVLGKWCGDKVDLKLAANSFTFMLPDGGSASYPIHQYQFSADTFTIEWSDKQRGAMETQFGKLASDNSTLVQIRGRSVSENKWNEYNRSFRRCP